MEIQTLRDQLQLIIQSLGTKKILKTHMHSVGASYLARAIEPSVEATDIFSCRCFGGLKDHGC